MSRRLKTDIPGTDYRIDAERLPDLDWEQEFAKDLRAPGPLVLELGFGRGEFLMHLAGEASERAHIGVEVSRKRVLKMARRVARSELCNVRLVHASAEHFAATGLRAASVEQVWINFSDPWPKKRHHPRRLVQPALLERLCWALLPGGTVEIATDDVPYAEHIDATLRAEAHLENVFAPDPWRSEVPGRPPTAYELEWRALGRPIHFWRYAKR